VVASWPRESGAAGLLAPSVAIPTYLPLLAVAIHHLVCLIDLGRQPERQFLPVLASDLKHDGLDRTIVILSEN
jgi:hypothetical protein